MANKCRTYAGGRACWSAPIRMSARRVALALIARSGEKPRLDDHQRAWLLADSKQYLEALTEDIDAGGVSIATARLITTVGATVAWLEGRGAPPGRPGIEYMGKNLASIYPRPSEHELFQRGVYLAAISDLGGDATAAAAIWREPGGLGDPDEWAKLLAFQGRKLRSLVRERGMTIRQLADRSEIDEVVLISLLFGTEEMRFEEMMRLAGALDVDPARLSEGVRFLSDPDGIGVVEIDPDLDVNVGARRLFESAAPAGDPTIFLTWDESEEGRIIRARFVTVEEPKFSISLDQLVAVAERPDSLPAKQPLAKVSSARKKEVPAEDRQSQ
jgi:transcriptional regulator with XRE-family HTH domain